MSSEILIAALAFAGTTIGTFGGIIANGKLTNHRIEQLEKKVDKHNHLVERMYDTEKGVELLDEKIKVVNHRINDLEGKVS